MALVQRPTSAQGPRYHIVATLDESAGILSAEGAFIIHNNTAAPLRTVAFFVPPAVHIREVKLHGASLSPAVSGDTLHVPLVPAPAPGDSVIVELQWSARSMQRLGREFTFAAWQPRVTPFAQVWLLLDAPVDQVISASGAVQCGNPGWSPDRRQTDRMTWRGTGRPSDNPVTRPRCVPDGSAGRKLVSWHAENVAEIGLALSPVFRYEEGDVLGFPMRAFYPVGDAQTWGSGVAASHLETAFAWLNEVFGKYPWPEATVVRTPAAADTVMAMQIWSDRPDQLKLMRALGRMYTGALVSVPNPADAWLTEGLAGFQTTWYLEEEGIRRPTEQLEREVLTWDLDGVSQPIAQPRAAFHDSATATAMIARRSELFLHALRAVVGADTLKKAFREFFAEHRFGIAGEATFRTAIERVSGRDLRATFEQWLRGTNLIDYAVRNARRTRTATGWRTDVRVDAHGPGRFPVTIWVLTDGDTGSARIAGRDPREEVAIETRGQPWRVLIDPEGQSHDWNALNNQRTFGRRLGRDRPTKRYLDTYFRKPSDRNNVTLGIAPIAWRTDHDGWTIGLRRRDDYLDRFELNAMVLATTTGWDVPAGRIIPQLSIDLRNPVRLRAPGWGQRIAGFMLDGRAGATIGGERSRRRSVATLPHHAVGLELSWLTVHTPAAVDSAVYDDAGTVELRGTARTAYTSRPWNARLAIGLTGGYQYANAGARAGVNAGAYSRITATAAAHSDSVAVFRLGLRVYAGRTFSRTTLVRQRLIYVSGADPYERMGNPFLRSPGALLETPDVRYHAPGGAGMRGLDPTLATDEAYGASLETDVALWRRGEADALARRASLVLFADAALADTGAGPRVLQSIVEAGFGIRLDHRIGSTGFQTRWDFPIWISRPELAQDRQPGLEKVGWRWVFSFSPAF
ncbi:MAG TPA: hypothetical protein VN803_12080 [Gemmatimonadales bacterium]|nr:hypothetical protein [Gemmatimonadales bacterium]